MKKIISLLLPLMICTASVQAAPNFGKDTGTAGTLAPTTASVSAGEMSVTSVPDFEDYFDTDSGAWELGNDFNVRNGALCAPKDSYAYCSTVYDKWQNFNMEFDFTIKEMTTFEEKGFWFGPTVRGTTFMFSRNLIQYKSAEAGVQNGVPIPIPLEDNITYSVKIEALDKKAVIYMKKKTETKYEKLGTLPVIKSEGKIGFESYPAGIAFDNIKVWDTTERPFKFAKISTQINVGESVKPEIMNKTGDALAFESTDSAIATVSADGTVTAVKAGKVSIAAKNSEGYSASTAVTVCMPVTAINLCIYDRELYIGESINFAATISPADATDKNLVWKSGDSSIISVMGEDSLAKGIKAEGVGTTELYVSTPDGKIDTSCTFTVTQRPALETGEAVFTMKGTSHKIPEYKFGLSSGVAQSAIESNMSREDYYAMDKLTADLVKDIGFVHIKPFMNSYDPKAGWTNTGRERPATSGPYYVKDFVDPINHAGVLAVWDSAVTTYETGGQPDMNLFIDILKEIKSLAPDKPLYVICTPEAYAMHYEPWLPTVKDYIKTYKELSGRVKSEVDPEAKIGITLCSPALYRGILSDPNNWLRWEGDLEYTQGSRVAEWHTSLAEDQSWYDAIDMHIYISPGNDVNVTADQFLQGEIALSHYSNEQGTLEIARLFPGKEIWCTEWNCFDMQFSKGSLPEMGRAQTQKTVGSAVVAMQAMGEHMTNEDLKISSYFFVRDVQGFGLVQGAFDDPIYLPYYYAVKGGGRIFGANSGNTHAYPLSLASGKIMEKYHHMNSDKALINEQEVYAYAFGDENNMKDVMFVNPSYKNMRVKITDAQLKKNWCYKPKKADEPYPEFYVRDEAFVDFDPSTVPLPETFEDGTFEEYIEIPPYSIVTANIQSSATRVSVPEKAKGALVLKVNSSNAILPDGFIRDVDAVNAEVKPIITPEGRTMVPMRIVAEAFKSFAIWNGEDSTIGIEAPNYRINMKIGSNELVRDIVNFREGDEETITLDVAPQIIEDRTMVPLRALSEAMEKNVFWDDETGLIVISNEDLGLTRDELNRLSSIIG